MNCVSDVYSTLIKKKRHSASAKTIEKLGNNDEKFFFYIGAMMKPLALNRFRLCIPLIWHFSQTKLFPLNFDLKLHTSMQYTATIERVLGGGKCPSRLIFSDQRTVLAVRYIHTSDYKNRHGKNRLILWHGRTHFLMFFFQLIKKIQNYSKISNFIQKNSKFTQKISKFIQKISKFIQKV